MLDLCWAGSRQKQVKCGNLHRRFYSEGYMIVRFEILRFSLHDWSDIESDARSGTV